ncbi:hypothetical protein QO001_006572 [Methylobacterium brachiatum]|jgi:hypothetical protein|uniref:HNH endonuclease n=1 Tax=Methylobacterium brachiatum TaxID=269660 RepID=A0AAJ1U1K2_9HYPH|nr:hypothetical protein [Methylobacterium brachiatum]MCB4806557.1 hypothetical protein [Methylobacterium brachiatum]MDQ0547613.1 hypothetical protein [Methylobacterium brachiatum]
MPIRPENRFFYPIDWVQLSQVVRFERAKGCCEGCGRPHGQLVCHLGDGRWWDNAAQVWRSGKGRKLKLAPPETLPADTPRYTTRVYLACAHLDHDPGNNAPSNLKALCQRCHILHDREEHQRQRWFTYRLRKAAGDLFLGPYPFRYL